jgi:F-type H+-transporting ATPase subunit epsilon
MAERADEIDVARAQQALERARSAGEDDDEAAAAASRAVSRLRAAGQSV